MTKADKIGNALLCIAASVFIMGCATVHHYAESGDTDAVEYYINNGGNINARDKNGSTILRNAVRSGNLKTVKLLVEKGAEINNEEGKGNRENSLGYAIRFRYNEIAKYLIDKGAKYNEGTFLEACRNGNTEMIKYFLEEKDFRINQLYNDHYDSEKNPIKRTALMLASRGDYINSYIDSVKLLIEKGADPNITNSIGESALLFSLFSGNEASATNDVFRYLIANGARIENNSTYVFFRSPIRFEYIDGKESNSTEKYEGRYQGRYVKTVPGAHILGFSFYEQTYRRTRSGRMVKIKANLENKGIYVVKYKIEGNNWVPFLEKIY